MPVKVNPNILSALAKRLVFSSLCSSDFYLSSISGISRAFWRGDFFRSASNEIGNSDHQAIQAGCSA